MYMYVYACNIFVRSVTRPILGHDSLFLTAFRRLLHFYPLRAVNCLNLGKFCPISQSADPCGYTVRSLAGLTKRDSTAKGFKMGRKARFSPLPLSTRTLAQSHTSTTGQVADD